MHHNRIGRWQILEGLFLLAAVQLAVIAPVGGSDTPPARSRYLLDPSGFLLRWDPGEKMLQPTHRFPHPVKDLAPIGNGDRLLVLPSSPIGEKTSRKRKKEGHLLILDAGRPALDLLAQIEIPGEGIRLVASLDGRLAYVLALRRGRSPTSAGGVWIHAIDLEAGEVVESSALASPPFDIALDPSGGRLFVSRPDRIETLTTHPLASSWHYRSPGSNRGLHVTASGVLHVARGHEVAQFDPRLITTRPSDVRQKLEDDATRIVPLSIESSEIFFSTDDRLAAAIGSTGEISFFDPRGGVSLGSPALPDVNGGVESLRPIDFPGEGTALVASFPSEHVVSIPLPVVTPVPHDLPESPIGTDEFDSLHPPLAESQPAQSPELLSESPQEPPERPAPASREAEASPQPQEAEPPSPDPPEAEPPVRAEARPVLETGMLRGEIIGLKELTQVVVVYGPDSIIREEARVRPDPAGMWQVVVSRPGRYRIVPLGPSGNPLQSNPNFRSAELSPGQGVDDLDFEILGRP
jgi:hypothetical protein